MRTREEEVVNAFTHLLWSVLSILSFGVALFSPSYDSIDKISILFMTCMSSWAFFSSFLYHAQNDTKYRNRSRVVDKSAIYLMIMGCGISLNISSPDAKMAAWSSILICLLGSACIVNLCIRKNTSESFSVFTYIMLGWLSAIPATGLLGHTIYNNTSTLWAIIAGGVCYSIGVVFYSRDNLKWNHTWWHIFVMAGYSLHLFAQLEALKM